jgi:hypothetical protein
MAAEQVCLRYEELLNGDGTRFACQVTILAICEWFFLSKMPSDCNQISNQINRYARHKVPAEGTMAPIFFHPRARQKSAVK